MKPKHFICLLIAGYTTFLILQIFFNSHHHKGKQSILLWWTANHHDRIITCKKHDCLVTGDKKYRTHKDLKAYLFYGTDIEDVPLPKTKPWALFHEESPKNLPMLMDYKVQQIFDITSTFSRFSTMPITLQYLKEFSSLTSKEFFVDLQEKNRLVVEGLAPVLYIQTDCTTPIERDEYVKELMKYVKVDSYGACLNNREIPKEFKLNRTYELYDENFMKFVSKYKFTIAIENAQCFDYITEKLWRPIIVGSIPIYLGSSSIRDWLPNEKSAILIDDFKSVRALADYIIKVNNNDELYNKHMEHKIHKKISNELLHQTLSKGFYGIENNAEDYVVPAFECFVCDLMNEGNFKGVQSESIYECEEPKGKDNFWGSLWDSGKIKAKQFVKKVHVMSF